MVMTAVSLSRRLVALKRQLLHEGLRRPGARTFLAVTGVAARAAVDRGGLSETSDHRRSANQISGDFRPKTRNLPWYSLSVRAARTLIRTAG